MVKKSSHLTEWIGTKVIRREVVKQIQIILLITCGRRQEKEKDLMININFHLSSKEIVQEKATVESMS